MFDTHTHTNHSLDSSQTIDALCQSAIAKGVQAVSLTDHVDVFLFSEEQNASTICESAADADYAQRTYGDRLRIFKGTEIGMFHHDIAHAQKLCHMVDPDIVLGSVHSFPFGEKMIRFSRDDLSEAMIPISDLSNYVDSYYDEMLKTAALADIDVLCHLTYPFRYTNGRYHRNLSPNLYTEKFTRILKILIERQIALEVNTARVGSDFDYTSPTFDIISEYYELGGRLITLGSDAHSSSNIANGFASVQNTLKSIGFREYFYFENRIAKAVAL